MYCIKKVTPTLAWVGGNDRRLAMFEGVYSVPDGVSYNSYVLMDEKIAVLILSIRRLRVFSSKISSMCSGKRSPIT